MASYEKDKIVFPTTIEIMLYDLRLYNVTAKDIEKGFPHLSNKIRKWHEEHDREGIRKNLGQKMLKKKIAKPMIILYRK